LVKLSKSTISIDLPETLETRIENVITKIEGQIALREALGGKSELFFLRAIVNSGRDLNSGAIYELQISDFKSHAENLIRKYY
jgi:hypothetical protein